MTNPPTELGALREQLEVVLHDVREIKGALMGNPMDSDPDKRMGYFQSQNEMRDDYYGNEHKAIRGSKSMVQILWDDRLKFLAYCGAVGALIGFGAWIIPMLLKK